MVIHNLFSPIAFSIGPLTIRWYGIGFALAFLIGEWAVRTAMERDIQHPVDTKKMFGYVLLGTVLGARVIHCLFYDPIYYLNSPWKFFAIWEGGLASHGGVIGFVVALAIATRKLPQGMMISLLDRVMIPAALGGAIVRVGNYVNSEILGIPTDGKFGVIFDSVDQVARHPVQLYEAAAYLALSLLLLVRYRLTNARFQAGNMTGTFLLGVFAARMLLEPLKVSQASYEVGQLFSVGQILSIPFLIVGLIFVIRSRGRARTLLI